MQPYGLVMGMMVACYGRAASKDSRAYATYLNWDGDEFYQRTDLNPVLAGTPFYKSGSDIVYDVGRFCLTCNSTVYVFFSDSSLPFAKQYRFHHLRWKKVCMLSIVVVFVSECDGRCARFRVPVQDLTLKGQHQH